MKTYYYIKNGKQAGPINGSEFIKLGLTGDTKVWTQGMKNWTSANNVGELKALFDSVTPPPFESDDASTLLCCLPAGVASIVYANKANSLWSIGRYEESMAATKNARLWLFISIGAGIVTYILCFIFGLFSSFM